MCGCNPREPSEFIVIHDLKQKGPRASASSFLTFAKIADDSWRLIIPHPWISERKPRVVLETGCVSTSVGDFVDESISEYEPSAGEICG